MNKTEISKLLKEIHPAHVWDLARQYYTNDEHKKEANSKENKIVKYKDKLCDLVNWWLIELK